MASPVVKNFTQAVLSDTGTVSSPSDTSIGDLVVCFVWSQFTTTATTHTIQSGFTTVRSHSHNDSTTCGRLSVATKVATAAGVQSYVPYTIASATAGQTCVGLITVTGANTVSPSTWVQGSSTNTGNQPPDPPSLTGLNNDALILAIGAWSVTTAGASSATVMASYTLNINGPTGTHVTHLAVASRGMTGLSNTTEDPAGFTDNVTPNGSVSMTIAIPLALITKGVADALTLSESVVRSSSFNRSLADPLVLSETVSKTIIGASAATYYVKSSGSNSNDGKSIANAWQTLTPVNAHTFLPGDTVLFEGGSTFTGAIAISNVASTQASPVTLDSYGTGRATISTSSTTTIGCDIYRMGGIVIQNLNFTGPGVTTATKEGIGLYNDTANNYTYVRINNCTVSGYFHGILVGGNSGGPGYTDVRIDHCDSHDNNGDGISTWGNSNYAIVNLYIGYCNTYNNTGKAGNPNPTGSGIVLGSANGALCEYCSAYGNGASNTNGSGPQGIWCYACNNATIQNCESYNNLSNGGDGGGLDIDGGCTGCIVQYCYSHGNKGTGLAFFQYSGATTFSNNIIRYCISENDQHSGVSLWGAGTGGERITNSQFYNNTIYSSVSTIVDVFNTNLTGITMTNNIFLTVGGKSFINYSSTTGLTFTRNNYYNISGAFLINWGGTAYNSLASWGVDATGLSVNPLLTNPGAGGTVGNPANFSAMTAYRLSSVSSPMVNAGTTVSSPGSFDFYGDILSGTPDIGSDEWVTSFINTRNRRSSVIGFDSPYRRVLPLPDGTIAPEDRSQLVGKYIAFYVPVVLLKSVSDALSVSESVGKISSFVRSISDALTLSETVGKILSGAGIKLLSDGIALSDAIAKTSSFIRSITDALSVAESVGKSINPLPISGITDAADRAQLVGKYSGLFVIGGALTKSLSDPLTLLGSVNATIPSAGALTKFLSDPLTLSENVSRIIPGDGIADAAGRAQLVGKYVGFYVSGVVLLKSVLDAISISESIARVSSLRRTIVDPITLLDSTIRNSAFSRSITDPLVLSDAISRKIARILSDNITMSDVLIKIVSYKRSLIDSLNIIEALTPSALFRMSLTDPLLFEDSISKLIVLVRSVSDSIVLGDIYTRSSIFDRSISDIILLDDITIRISSFGRSIIDGVDMRDILTPRWDYRRSIGDPIQVNDQMQRSLTFFRALVDSISLTGNVTSNYVRLINLAEALGLLDLSTFLRVQAPPLKFPKYYTSRVQRRGSIRDVPYGPSGGGPTIGMHGRGQRSIRRHSPWD